MAGGAFNAATFEGLKKDTMFVDPALIQGPMATGTKLIFIPVLNSLLVPLNPHHQSTLLFFLPMMQACSHGHTTCPGTIFHFEIWRSDAGGQFSLVGTTAETSYKDNDGVFNGIDYCYKIIAYGDYGLDMVPAPLINLLTGNLCHTCRQCPTLHPTSKRNKHM